MLTFRKGAAGGAGSAQAMAAYLSEQTLPEQMVSTADYFLRGVSRADAMGTAAIPRQDMDPSVAEALGIDPTRTVNQEELTNLLRGLRTDGTDLPEAERRKSANRIGWTDYTFSADKSVSLAFALAETPAERHMIAGAHRDAWASAMEHLETIVGHARQGAGGSKGSIPGQIGYISFDHYTARPTVEIPHTEKDGTASTLIQSVPIAADPQLHTHVITPNLVVCKNGTVGSTDMAALHNQVHTIGALYQAHLATNLRAVGIATELDAATGSARITAIPEALTDLFSKRSKEAEAHARKYLADWGQDWDGMTPKQISKALKGAAQATRLAKESPLEDFNSWKAQAEAIGYRHRSVVDPELKHQPQPSERDRLMHAYLNSLPLLEAQLGQQSTLYATDARAAAARGLIASGIKSAADIDRITDAMETHGVRHDGQTVPLIYASLGGDGPELENRYPRIKITTPLHVEQEKETMKLAAKAAQDRRGALSPDQIEQAVKRVSERDGLDFSQGHGLEQRKIIDAIGTGGRFTAVIGVGGSGKTTLLRPLVEAWGEDNRTVYGTALAWRQAEPLADAGIRPENAMATAMLLSKVEKGTVTLDARSIVIVDEISQISTGQVLKLARLQAEHGFSMVAVGDDRQGQAIEAGNTVRLLQKALGKEAVPELVSTVRQVRDRDKETSLLFRSGNASEGIARLREDGHAILVPGGRKHAIEAAADLWQSRHQANANRERYNLTISAPTNADARAISAAIRERRRSADALGPDIRTIQASDQNGARYDLPLAKGDKVRLFARTQASFGGAGGNIGHNGSVLTVEDVEAKGVTLRTATGRVGFVRWDNLRDKTTKQIRLTYGDVQSIDSVQGTTSTEHLNVLPGGSKESTGFKGYVAQSRAKETTFLVVSDGAERIEVAQRRALGSPDPVTNDDVWANIARNLSRQPEKELATDLIAHATTVRTGQVRSLATAFQPKQEREIQGQESTVLHRKFAERQDIQKVKQLVAGIEAATAHQANAVQKVTQEITGPSAASIKKAVREVRQDLGAGRAHVRRARPVISPTDAQAEFARALEQAGFRLKGAPVMDGKMHRAAVEGDRGARKSGSYVGHLDNYPAGYIHNFKTGGDGQIWKASGATVDLSADERRIAAERAEAQRAARDEMRHTKEVKVSRNATQAWNRARPVEADHPYLERKGIEAHHLRQGRDGKLLVPMRDEAGKIWNVQKIAPDGTKLFMAGRKQGTSFTMGEMEPGAPVVLVEGFATAATIRETTGLTTVVAFDAGNLLKVAQQLRAQDPTRPIIIAADHDHHLPRRVVPLPNVGLEKANAAAAAVKGTVLLPDFGAIETQPLVKGQTPPTDWNDFAQIHGAQAVRRHANEALSRHGLELSPNVGEKPVRLLTQAEQDAARQAVEIAAERAVKREVRRQSLGLGM